MAEGLLHRCCCMGPLSGVVAAPLTGWTTREHVGGPWLLQSKWSSCGVSSACRGDHLGVMNAALLLLVRLWHVARGVTRCSCGLGAV